MTRPPAPSTGCTSAAPTCSGSSAAGSPTACSARSARCSCGGILITVGNALLALGSSAAVLPRPDRHRDRRRAAQAQRAAPGGLALPGRRLAPRRRLLHLLHGHQRRRAARPDARAAGRAAASAGTPGFVLPALGMALGVAQFLWTRRYLHGAGLAARRTQRGSWTPVVAVPGGGRGCVVIAGARAARSASNAGAAGRVRLLGVRCCSALGYFVYLLFFAGLNASERKRALVMVALFVASVDLLGAATSSRAPPSTCSPSATPTCTCSAGTCRPACCRRSNPFFVITFAPVFAALWIALGRRGLDFVASDQVRRSGSSSWASGSW